MLQYEMLTERQQRIVAAVRDARAKGYTPSYREICVTTGIKGPATVHQELKYLERIGVVRLTVVQLKDAERRIIELPLEPPPVSVPLIGTIAAGQPLMAEQHIEARYALPTELIGTGDLFMLRVRGDSMTGANVFDGDYVVVRSQRVVENGEMVAAVLDGAEPEATVKYWSLDREGGQERDEEWDEERGRAVLQPANPDYEPIDGSNATILGKVIAIIRTLP
jgi:repressor LexA